MNLQHKHLVATVQQFVLNSSVADKVTRAYAVIYIHLKMLVVILCLSFNDTTMAAVH